MVFGCGEHFQNATYGLAYILPIQRDSDNLVLKHIAWTEVANLVSAGRAITNV